MNIKTKLLLVLTLVFGYMLNAQNIPINGVVTDLNNMPIPGVNVIIVGTSTGTTTDFDGAYTINAKKGDVLQFTYVGYASQTKIIGDNTTINIALKEDISKLDEVVVVAYGEQKQKNVTSALTKIDSKEIQDIAVARVEDALQGRVAGLRIQTVASEAGGDPKITLRGPGSITGSSSPLIVVDGVVLGTDADILSSIDNNNIESISVLKDASSVAIYGSRGANGVILVTLKQGIEGKTRFTFNSFTGYKYATDNENFTFSVAEERTRLDGLQSAVDEIADPVNFARVNLRYNQAYAELAAWDYLSELSGGELDLQKEILPGGTITSHSFGARGGSKLTKYSASVAYLEDEGIALADNFKKYNANLKIDTKSQNEKIKAGVNLRASYNDQDRLPARFTDALRQYGAIPLYLNQDHLDIFNAYRDAGGSLSTAGTQYENLGVGSYGFSRLFDRVFFQDQNNPRTILRDPNTGLPVINTQQGLPGQLTLGLTRNVHPLVPYLERSRIKRRFSLNAAAYVDFKLAKGLNFKQTISGIFRHTKNNNTDFVAGNENIVNFGDEGFRFESRDEVNQYVIESVLRYKRGFGKHNFNTILGFEFTNRDFSSQDSEAFGVYSNDFNENIALADGGTTFTQNGSDKLVSYFGRLDYNYDEKYLVQISARTDGSTRFGSNTRYGFFPAASVGWNVSSEDFLSNSDVITFLKLRASYGISGSNQISNNIYDSLYRFEETFAIVSANGESGVKNTALANADLGWEKLVEFNPGLDITFGRNLFSLTADYYTRTSEDLILSAPVSAAYGVDTFLQNIGKVRNQGVELAINSRIWTNENFSWRLSGQFGLNRNEVLDLGGNEQIISRIDQESRPTEFIARIGLPITSFYGYVFDREIDIDFIENPFNRFNNDFAEVYVKDLNGDGIIDADDRTEIGSPYPDFTWGFNSDISYKNLDFTFQFQGSHGGEVRVADLDQLLFASEGAVQATALPEVERDKVIPRRFTSAHIQDASFVTLRNITIGYTLPEYLSNKLNFDRLRLYVTGNNLLYWTAQEYQGFNPEAAGQTSSNANTPLTAGYQRGDGPVVRTISAGINFQF
ncbi:SusC/RagA family TonB-linked outer membrane protein [Hyunsoonleella pacifica]|nr:TonB-dependent receptor [Hyunsoonleella pacifica]GGD27490.1 SusC/RagA family TonB-linked outer membrane protein [Hyunsoonleella pacifica]